MSDNEALPSSTRILCPRCLGHGFIPGTLLGFNKPPREVCNVCHGELEVEWPGKPMPDPKMVRCPECHSRMPVGYKVCIYCAKPNPRLPEP